MKKIFFLFAILFLLGAGCAEQGIVITNSPAVNANTNVPEKSPSNPPLEKGDDTSQNTPVAENSNSNLNINENSGVNTNTNTNTNTKTEPT